METRAEKLRKQINESIPAPIDFDPSKSVCVICGQAACESPFIAFPCKHFVHNHCYSMKMDMFLTEDQLSEAIGIGSLGKDLKGKITDMLQRSCPACGPAALRVIDVPFVTEDDINSMGETWEVPFC